MLAWLQVALDKSFLLQALALHEPKPSSVWPARYDAWTLVIQINMRLLVPDIPDTGQLSSENLGSESSQWGFWSLVGYHGHAMTYLGVLKTCTSPA